MIVARANQKLVLKVRNPDALVTTIATARKFLFEGQTYVAVPHRVDEVRVLRNMGFAETPAPVEYYYEWPGQYRPFRAQLETTAFLTTHWRAFCLNDMGTGKTLAVLWAFDYLKRMGLVRRMVVMAPLSTLERTWADEVFMHFPDMRVAVLHGTKDRRQKLLAGDADIYLINHDGVGVIEAELIAKAEIDVVVIDEIASFRNAQTARWKSLNKVCVGRKVVWGLTGTPTPNLPTDAWAQCRIICPERVPKYAGKFRDATMKQLGQFKWVARDGATEIVVDAMQPAIRFKMSDCVDLPPMTYSTRQIALTPEQKSAYKDMLSKLTMEFRGDKVKAVNEAVKLSKLLQIACGVAYGVDGAEVVLPTQPRIQETMDIIEQAGGKVIVFVPFKAALRWVAAELGKHYSTAMISGDVTKTQRDTIFHNFQAAADPRVLVAQPDAMSHGLTLTAADTTIWYGPTQSNETYEQANARMRRPGQKRAMRIVHLEGSPVERRTYERLSTKQRMQGRLLDIIREG